MPVVALTVRHFLKVTPRSRILTLDLDAPFAFRAGQAAVLGRRGGGNPQPYSIASAPEDAARHGCLEFLVRTDVAGQVGAHLRGVRRGMVVDLEGPLGSFQFPGHVTERRILFVAGGTGIAPIRSMLRHAMAAGYKGRLVLAYSARSDREFAFLPEFRRLARQRRLALSLTVTRAASPGWRGGRGRLTATMLAPLLADRDALCFVCGPSALVADVPAVLRDLGVAGSRIRLERW